MKVYKIFISTICACLLGANFTSCGDSFLKEELITQLSTDYFKTQEGLDALALGSYSKFKVKFNYFWSETSQAGTDEMTHGNNGADYNSYSSNLNSSDASVKAIWDDMYALIDYSNLLLQNLPLYYDQSNSNYNTRLGEAYFFRGYAYQYLTTLFGGVPIKLTPSTGVETYFTRTSEEECWAQVISDLTEAYKLLPVSVTELGRLKKTAAAHFVAKAHLFRASERCSSWNSSYKDNDLEKVISYAKEVVTAHPLCDDYSALWAYTEPNGANEQVSEIVLSAQFSDDASTQDRYKNRQHVLFSTVYQNLAGTNRDISGDREFDRFRATDYSITVFDRVNDSRFWKSFITAYGCNNTSGAPTWTASDMASGFAPAGVSAGEKRFVGGDIAIKYVLNEVGDTRYEEYLENDARSLTRALKNGILQPEHMFVRYFKGEARNWNDWSTNAGNNFHKTLERGLASCKWRDGSRLGISTEGGNRDGILARSAEDVLMIAEAYVRLGSYNEALSWINMLRERASFAQGEDRSYHIDGGVAYLKNTACTGKGGGYSADGAIFYDKNTYYESNGDMAVTTASTKNALVLTLNDIYTNPVDALIYDRLNITSDADKMMCFILNERTRELSAELYRWEDLSRTKTLETRYSAFNSSATLTPGNFKADTHYYRPIPQSFLDGITSESGKALTNEEKQALQNPGY